MTPEINRIAEKLQALRTADPKCLLFGTYTHRYRLGPRLSPTQIQAIENQYGISLPADYAAFLSDVGNGGAGPGYGLQRFGFVQSKHRTPTAEPKGPLRVIHRTANCTISAHDLFDHAGNKVDPFDISLFDSIQNLAPDGDSGPSAPGRPFPLTGPLRNAEQDPRWATLNPAHGTLMLADYGCGMTAHLVLTGPFRGHIWLYDPNASWFVPFSETASLHYTDTTEVDADPDATFTFPAWYEHWLDHALEGISAEYQDDE